MPVYPPGLRETDAYRNYLNAGLDCPDAAQHDGAGDPIQRFLGTYSKYIFDRTQDEFRKYLTAVYEPVCPKRTPEVDQNMLSALLVAVAIKAAVMEKARMLLGAMALIAFHMNAIVDSQIRIIDYKSEEPPKGPGIRIAIPGE